MDTYSAKQLKILRNISPAQKLETARQLFQTAWELKRAGIKMFHPDWKADQIEKATRDFFLYARS